MALNKNLKILLYGGNIWYFAEGMLGPLFAVFTEKIGGAYWMSLGRGQHI